MSRSYRKHPILKDNGNSAKSMKRYANKKVRHLDLEELPKKGRLFRRFFPQYDIHDWICYWPWSEAKKSWETQPDSWYRRTYPTLEEFFIYWVKCMKCK